MRAGGVTFSLRAWPLLLVIAALLLFAAPLRAETIVVAADEWCPYNCAPNSHEPGYAIELMQRIFSAHGHTVEYVVLPWKRALTDAEAGTVDCVVGAIREEAPGLVFPGEELGSLDVGFFTIDPRWRYAGKDSLKGMVFGIADGYSYGKEIDRMIAKKEIRVEAMSGRTPLELNMDKLRYGRIQGIIADRNVFNYVAARKSVSQSFYYGGSVGGVTALYVAFSPKRKTSARYAAIFSKGMKRLRESGEMEAILSKYGLTDWK